MVPPRLRVVPLFVRGLLWDNLRTIQILLQYN